jgi:deazaflavin-dependent oxidoreductase (nitroreductase family)
MPTKIKEVQPPRGLTRILYRLPISLYRLRLGWLLGDRFLLLIHTGRVSGAPRQTVLEIIRHDKKEDAYVVVSAWGEKSDWYRNIQKTPQVIVQVGRKRVEAVAERLSQENAEREILDYARRYPRLLRALARLMGYQLEDSEQDYRALARLVPVVAFYPKGT